jgi:hypothetical protein
MSASDVPAAAQAYVAGLAAIDACYPDVDRAAALAAPHDGPDRDVARKAIAARWNDITTTRTRTA